MWSDLVCVRVRLFRSSQVEEECRPVGTCFRCQYTLCTLQKGRPTTDTQPHKCTHIEPQMSSTCTKYRLNIQPKCVWINPQTPRTYKYTYAHTQTHKYSYSSNLHCAPTNQTSGNSKKKKNLFPLSVHPSLSLSLSFAPLSAREPCDETLLRVGMSVIVRGWTALSVSVDERAFIGLVGFKHALHSLYWNDYDRQARQGTSPWL